MNELATINNALTKAAAEILTAAEAAGDNPTISRAKDDIRTINGAFHNLALTAGRAKTLGLTGVEGFLTQMIELNFGRVVNRLESNYDFPAEKGRIQRDAVLAACGSYLAA